MGLQRFGRFAPQNPLTLMFRYYRYILPDVRSQLANWRMYAETIPDPELRKQALASINSKQFHCEGGAVYASADPDFRGDLVSLIVAFQTISDYLDNLCDRSTSLNGADFRQLHQSMMDATDPEAVPANYYALHSETEDGGYLTSLVQECQRRISKLPAYKHVQTNVQKLVGLYSDLQVHKHIHKDLRERELLTWWNTKQSEYPSILWNEFAAATGSTLGVFMLFVAAADPSLIREDANTIESVYFPYLCGLHILLDYLIDQEEDRLGGDLNFCNYYESPIQAADRIGWIADEARKAAKQLAAPKFHKMIAEGLLALYLSDPKAGEQSGVKIARNKLMKKSPIIRVFFWFNSMWVRKTQ